MHDGQSGSGSALIASLIAGNPCASKMSNEENIPAATENHFHLNAYPNPFSNELNIEFSLPENAHAKLEIYNLSGQLLDVLFNGNVQASALQRIEYKPEITSGGVLIYKLQTQQTIYYGKAMMVK